MKKAIIIILVSIFVIAAAALTIVLFHKNNPEKTTDSVSELTENSVHLTQIDQNQITLQDTQANSFPQGYSNSNIGDVIVFGKYDKDENYSNEIDDLEWIVLDKQADRILIITKYCIDQSPYHCENKSITWHDCTLRRWMNTTFKDKAFSYAEQQRIIRTTVQNEDNPQYGTDGGLETEDDIFALSVSQAKEYFSSDELRRGVSTDYAKLYGAFAGDSYGTSWWWLRTPGENQTKAVLVNTEGCIVMRGGERVNMDNDAVRPAMWITTEANTESKYPDSISGLLNTNGSDLSTTLKTAADATYSVNTSYLFEDNPSLAVEMLQLHYTKNAIHNSVDVYSLYPLADQAWIETTCRIQSFDADADLAILQVDCKCHFFYEDATGESINWDGTWQGVPQKYLKEIESTVTMRFEDGKWKVDACEVNSPN